MEKRTKALMMALGGIALGLALQKQSLACETGMFCPSSGSDCYCQDDDNSQPSQPQAPTCYQEVKGYMVVDQSGASCGAGTANVINVDENDPPNNEPTQTSMGISPDSGLCSAFNACPPPGTVLTGTAVPGNASTVNGIATAGVTIVQYWQAQGAYASAWQAMRQAIIGSGFNVQETPQWVLMQILGQINPFIR